MVVLDWPECQTHDQCIGWNFDQNLVEMSTKIGQNFDQDDLFTKKLVEHKYPK